MGSKTLTSAALGLGALLLLKALEPRERYSFQGKTVVITGGARGLGLLLARELADEGAKLALLARDSADLDRAARELSARGAEVLVLPCDVRARGDVDAAAHRIIEHYGRIDVLINDAGIITVGPVEHMELSDFEDAMATHYWGPLYFMRAVVPHMKANGGGRIVNIASVGGRVAVPHLTPYCASKFALVGLSDGMRNELAKDNITITTVCPGVLRTGAHVNVQYKGQHEHEYAWFATAASTPFVSIQAERAARQIIAAARRGAAHLTVSLQANALGALNALAPGVTAKIMALTATLLPAPTDASGDQPRTGWDVRADAVPAVLTHFGDQAADANNELHGRAPLAG